jgi:hypothetical protein
VPAGSGEATEFPRGMVHVEWCWTEHQGSERCGGVDVNTDVLISASQFIHLSPFHRAGSILDGVIGIFSVAESFLHCGPGFDSASYESIRVISWEGG